MANTVEDLEKLAETCLATAKTLKSYLAQNGHAQPTFDQNGPSFYPEMSMEAQFARLQLRHASKTLHDLASGADYILGQSMYNSMHDINSFRYVFQYKIAQAVPLNETISFEDLAAKTGTTIGQMQPMLRQLMMIHVFCEPKPGFVAHTASSKLLAEHAGLQAFNQFICVNTLDYAAKQIGAINKWGHGSQEPNQTAVQVFYDTDKIYYDYWEASDRQTQQRFGKLMTYVSGADFYSAAHLLAYDWSALGECTVVDVAGNMGHCSVYIIQGNPKAKCVVQDLPHVVAAASDPSTSVIPPAYQDRISFETHNFYDAQPIKDADVYFMRMIMHNYSDKYCCKILEATLSAMKPGARLVIMDQVLPPVGVIPPVIERATRTQDLQMLLLQNAREREYAEWEALFAKVDRRLKISKVITPPGSLMAIIEVVLVQD